MDGNRQNGSRCWYGADDSTWRPVYDVAVGSFALIVKGLTVATQRKRSLAFANNGFNGCSRNMTAGPPAPDMEDLCPRVEFGSTVYSLNECLVLQDSLGRNGLGLSLGFAHGSHHSAGAAAAEEEIAAIGFKARYANA